MYWIHRLYRTSYLSGLSSFKQCFSFDLHAVPNTCHNGGHYYSLFSLSLSRVLLIDFPHAYHPCLVLA